MRAWLDALCPRGCEWRFGPESVPVYVARNQVVRRFQPEDST
jgi:hypothetical protein